MTQPQPQPPYTMNDLLLLLGQSTVELAYLRGQMAQLQQRLAELEPSPNGVARVPGEVISAGANPL
jgi:hypothetical protein